MPENTTEPGAANAQGQNNQNGSTGNQQTEIVFEEWLSKQDEGVRKAYETHTTGLQNTIKATRQERDDLTKQLRELAKKAEKGSELETALNDAIAKQEVAEKRARFAEEAVSPKVGCTNVKAAFLLAQADNLFDRSGNPDWEAIKAAAPELFQKRPPLNGGSGTGNNLPAGHFDMNDYIRKQAGIGSE